MRVARRFVWLSKFIIDSTNYVAHASTEMVYGELGALSPLLINGPTGVGKSHLLELIAACAHRLGLSQGIEIPRGDPFGDEHEFSLQFYLAAGVSEAIDQGLAEIGGFREWDRTLTIQSQKHQGNNRTTIEAGCAADAH